jgi:hypothetical protein
VICRPFFGVSRLCRLAGSEWLLLALGWTAATFALTVNIAGKRTRRRDLGTAKCDPQENFVRSKR